VSAGAQPLDRGMTLQELRAAAVKRLRAAGIEAPEFDVRILLKLALGLDDAGLVSAGRAPISAQEQACFDRLIARRMTGEPIARIAGEKEFWSRSFKLGADTLEPRPETETLVEVALSIFPGRNVELRVLDLGTGSGILLATILLERPRAIGVGVDRSEAALRIARENLKGLGLGDRAQFIRGDWSAALATRFDLIVANPPYIASTEIATLSREVRDHDPRLALDGGADGLDAYRAIIAELPQLLSARGAAILELGIGQEEAVTLLARAKGLRVEDSAQRDLGNVARALIVYPPKQK
jgi:release factor glutamine methyltransferase